MIVTLIDRVLRPYSLAARLRQRSRKKTRKFRQSEIMILRYPKSGVTWLRVMLSRIYQQRLEIAGSEIIGSTRFHNIAPEVPKVFLSEHIIDPRLTAEMKTAIGVKKTILLVRDPRDITVSMYFHLSKRSTDLERAVYAVPDDFTNEGVFPFAMNPVYGMPRAIAFINAWWDQVSTAPNALIVRYEDMRRDPASTLRQVMGLMGAEASEAEIEESVAYAAFENMKERERSGFFRSEVLRPTDLEDEDSYKVRKGEVGGFAQYFTAKELMEINALLQSTLKPRAGYR